MQDVWDDHVGDTNEIPDCIQLHGRVPYSEVSGRFKNSLFAFAVARRLEWLATQPTSSDSVSRDDWYIFLKNAQGRWMQVITVSGRTREEAEKCAKDGLRYYEGTTDWRVSLSPND